MVQFVHFLESRNNLGPGAGNALANFTVAPLGATARAIKKAFGAARYRTDTTCMDEYTIPAAFAFFGPGSGLIRRSQKSGIQGGNHRQGFKCIRQGLNTGTAGKR
jgi:hypothetical protein